MYMYETHLHTAPVSKCASASVERTLRFYRELNYDGVFITNHFLDGNINIEKEKPYNEKLDYYLSDYEEALRLGKSFGLRIFFGTELSYKGTDFLIYGLMPDWYRAHPEIMEMSKTEELALMRNEGALVVQAHPFREDWYIDHIRLFPRAVEAVETINACRTDFENEMADRYADAYGRSKTAGSDNHVAEKIRFLAGMATREPIADEADFLRRFRAGETELFFQKNPLLGE